MSCSTQLSMKFILFISIKITKINGFLGVYRKKTANTFAYVKMPTIVTM